MAAKFALDTCGTVRDLYLHHDHVKTCKTHPPAQLVSPKFPRVLTKRAGAGAGLGVGMLRVGGGPLIENEKNLVF